MLAQPETTASLDVPLVNCTVAVVVVLVITPCMNGYPVIAPVPPQTILYAVLASVLLKVMTQVCVAPAPDPVWEQAPLVPQFV